MQKAQQALILNLAILDWDTNNTTSYSNKVDILRTIASWYYTEPQQIMGYALAVMRVWGEIQYINKEYEL